MATVDGLFARQASLHPDTLAVRGHDGELTYGQLEAAANQIAHHLREMGVRTGDVVGIHVERSAASVVMLLAVLKAGAAYLALDRRHPAARRRLILQDASVRFVLTRRELVSEIPRSCRPVCLDEDRTRISGQPMTAPPSEVTPEHVAYVAYTSGSSGRPKGVCVPHRAVVRLVVGADFLVIGRQDVFLQFAPLAFDASTLELWGPLLNGGRLTVAPPTELSLNELADLVRREGVTVLWLTAGLFHRAVETGLEGLRGLRYLVAGGDVLSVPHVNRAVQALPRTRVVNGYGPTENTTFTCCHSITAPVREPTVPIGMPIAGTHVHVLDDDLRPVADGELGELYACGLGVAHGYLNSSALTAERFVADPYSTPPGARMYRTGDLVRRIPGGAIEFLGRRDQQVKIRGFRVEIGEVESTLAQLPEVAEAAVVAQRQQQSGDLRLIAHVVGANGDRPSAMQIRRRAAEVLPSYAVPARVCVIDALPLTSNGKIDRGALAARAAQDRPTLNTAHREPESPIERAVVQVWVDHLGILDIGVDDDFFELGGHSLLAVTIIAELYEAYGVEISPLSFYLDPNPAGLARTLQQIGVAP